MASEIIAGAREAGMNDDAAVFVETPEEASELLIRDVKAGDCILVKGSRGVKTESVVQRVKQEFEPLPNTGDAPKDETRRETRRQMA